MIRSPLIFATHRPPFPLENGTLIRNARLAQELCRVFDLTLVTFVDGPTHDDTSTSRADLEALLPRARLELVPYTPPRPSDGGHGVGQSQSHTWGTFATPGLRRALSRLVRESPTAVLHLDSPGAGLAGVGLAPGRTVYSGHNIEHRVWRDVAARRPPGERGYVEIEWRKIELEERRCWLGADLCIAVSDVDAETMRAAGARRVVVCPNGTDLHDPLPPAAPSAAQPLRLVFVGNGAYWPYEYGLAWFVRRVMPLLQAGGPVAFDVVGAPPADPVGGPGVTYHGRVSDVRPYYARAHALVVPMFEGSGTRLKVIEAAFLGRPVISTAHGVEGLPLRAGEQYLRAETAPEWVMAVDRVRAGTAAPMPAKARAVLRELTWPRVAAGLADTYRQLISGR